MPYWIRVIGTTVGVISLLSAAMQSGGRVSAGVGDTSGAPIVLDPFDTPAYIVTETHASGRAAFCHLRVGVWEPGRPDSARLVPAATAVPAGPADLVHIGPLPTVETGARWLDPDRWRLAVEVLQDRLGLCAAKGFDGAILTHLAPGRHPTASHPPEPTRALIEAAHRYHLIVVLIGPAGAGFSAVPSPAAAAGTSDTRRTTGS